MAGIDVVVEMTATIWKIHVQEGDLVAAGDTLVTLESMKMEIPVVAPSGGTVTLLALKEGAPVVEGAVVCRLESS